MYSIVSHFINVYSQYGQPQYGTVNKIILHTIVDNDNAMPNTDSKKKYKKKKFLY